MLPNNWDTPIPEVPDPRTQDELAEARHRQEHRAQIRDLEYQLAAWS